jgi:glutamyl-tRNA synthetase/glutamyl-Q tRNA(Asp) synthetase
VRLEPGFVTRFAPSPTGYLHLGHVVNALWVWETARRFGGKVLLRIEDHDRTRCRPEYERALLDDLDWLGLEPDIAPIASFRAGRSEYRQSDSGAHYEAALERLRAAGLAYVCECSRKDIAAEVPDRFNEEMRYPGTCRGKGLAPAARRGWRVVMEEGDEAFDDLRLGPHRQSPAEQCGDLLVRDRLGNWTYQFSVTVDDMRHGVDLVPEAGTVVVAAGGGVVEPACVGTFDRSTQPVPTRRRSRRMWRMGHLGAELLPVDHRERLRALRSR